MALLKGSRYEGLKVFVYKDEKGRMRKALDIRPPVTLDSVDQVNLKPFVSGDYLDLVAILNGASREELWYLIADINAIEKPLNITPGTMLYIPLPSVFMRY